MRLYKIHLVPHGKAWEEFSTFDSAHKIGFLQTSACEFLLLVMACTIDVVVCVLYRDFPSSCNRAGTKMQSGNETTRTLL